MKNKIALINFPDNFEISEESEVCLFYDVVTFGKIKEFILCLYHHIIVYNMTSEFQTHEYNFYRRIATVNSDSIKSIINNPLEYFDAAVGRERLVNPRQFEIIKGTVVKSKIDRRLGLGIVVGIEGDNIRVIFPEAKNYYRSNLVKCHKSNLRVLTNIEEVKRNEQQKLT